MHSAIACLSSSVGNNIKCTQQQSNAATTCACKPSSHGDLRPHSRSRRSPTRPPAALLHCAQLVPHPRRYLGVRGCAGGGRQCDHNGHAPIGLLPHCNVDWDLCLGGVGWGAGGRGCILGGKKRWQAELWRFNQMQPIDPSNPHHQTPPRPPTCPSTSSPSSSAVLCTPPSPNIASLWPQRRHVWCDMLSTSPSSGTLTWRNICAPRLGGVMFYGVWGVGVWGVGVWGLGVWGVGCDVLCGVGGRVCKRGLAPGG